MTHPNNKFRWTVEEANRLAGSQMDSARLYETVTERVNVAKGAASFLIRAGRCISLAFSEPDLLWYVDVQPDQDESSVIPGAGEFNSGLSLDVAKVARSLLTNGFAIGDPKGDLLLLPPVSNRMIDLPFIRVMAVSIDARDPAVPEGLEPIRLLPVEGVATTGAP
ncbi:MAG TPA: hypothetical protein VJ836_01145 [Candidatus Saccharimonadales bacterium]|nr:hypothetical protein [Candidatus Saccharimonadales bacterium]